MEGNQKLRMEVLEAGGPEPGAGRWDITWPGELSPGFLPNPVLLSLLEEPRRLGAWEHCPGQPWFPQRPGARREAVCGPG